MPSTWTSNLVLEKPATGEQAGVWGDIANKSYDFLDAGIDGSISIQLSASAYTLRTDQNVDSVGRSKVIVFTGGLTQDGSISIQPNTAKKIYFVTNHTTGGFALNFTQGTGGSFTLQNGRSAMIYANGIGGASIVLGALADLQVNSLLVQAGLIVQGAVTLDLGSDAAYDMYYRGAGGTVTRLANGTAGQVLTATASGPAWATVSAGIGSAIAGGAAGSVLFVDGALKMAQDANFLYAPTVGLGLGMVAQHALSVGRALPATIQLDVTGPSPAERKLLYSTNNLSRWTLGTSNEAESGGNTGSNLILGSYNDAGSSVFYNLVSYRTGRSVFGAYGDNYGSQLAVVSAAPAQTAFLVQGAVSQTGLLQRWQDSNGNAVAAMDKAGILQVGALGVAKAPAYAIDVTGDVNVTGVFRVNGVALSIPAAPPGPFTTQTVYIGRTLGTIYTNGPKVIFTSVALTLAPNSTVQVFSDGLPNLSAPNPSTLITSVANPSGVSVAAGVGFWTMPGFSLKVVQATGSATVNSWIEYV